ncbi:MAG: WD40 repeat domain-containing protein [Leptolyngbya sp. BL-A-14]
MTLKDDSERSMFHCLYTRGGGPHPNSFYLADDGETVFSCSIVDDRYSGGTLYTAIKGWNLHTREWTHTLSKRFAGWIEAYTSPAGIVLAQVDETSVEVWDLQTEQTRCMITQQGFDVHKMVVSRQGRCLVGFQNTSQQRQGNKSYPPARDWTGFVRVLDLETGRQLYGWTVPGRIESVAISANGQFVAIGYLVPHAAASQADEPTQGGLIQVWDLYLNQVLDQWVASTGKGVEVSSIAFSPDGQWLAASLHRSKLKIWNLHTGEFHGILPSYKSFPNPINRASANQYPTKPIAFTPDSQFLFSPDGTQGVVIAWHIPSKRRIQTFNPTTRGRKDLHELQLLPASPTHPAYLVAEQLNVWDLQTGRSPSASVSQKYPGQKVPIRWLLFPSDQPFMIAASVIEISVWNVQTGSFHHDLTGYIKVDAVALVQDMVGCLSVPDDYYNATPERRSAPKTIYRWHWQTAAMLPPIPAPGEPVALGANGTIVYRNPQHTEIWSMQTATRSQVIPEAIEKFPQPVVSDDGGVLVGKVGERLKAWNLHTGELIQLLRISGNVVRLALSPMGRYLVYAYQDQAEQQVMDVFNGDEVSLQASERFRTFTVSTDEQLIVSPFTPLRGNYHSPHAHEIRVWDAQTGHLLRSLTYHQAPVIALTISQDGQWILSCDRDGIIKLGDLHTGVELTTLTERSEGRPSLTITPDQQNLIVITPTWIKVWSKQPKPQAQSQQTPLLEQPLETLLEEWLQTAAELPSEADIQAGIAQFEAFTTYFESLSLSQQKQLAYQIQLDPSIVDDDSLPIRRYTLMGEQAGFSFDANAVLYSDKWDEIQVATEAGKMRAEAERRSSELFNYHGQE